MAVQEDWNFGNDVWKKVHAPPKAKTLVMAH
jgi:hypothetical protein